MSASPVRLGSRAILSFLLVSVLTAVHAPPSSAQYMYLDANSDGIHTAADQVNPSGPTVIDIWLDTDSNRDGSPAVCSTGDGLLTVNSYEFSLRASNGTVAWGPYTNRQPGMGVHFPEGSSETEYANGYGGPTANPPGLYRLGTLQVTILSGSPSIAVVTGTGVVPPISPGYPTRTAFGSRCSGLDFDNTLKLGSDWFDTDGLPFGSVGQPNSAPSVSPPPSPMTVATGETASQTLSATDSDLQPILWQLVSGPSWAKVATVTSENGLGTGRVVLSPGISDAGTATAVIGVSDVLETSEYSIPITVVEGPNHLPQLVPVEEVRAPVELVSSRALHALDPDGQSLTFAKTSGPNFVQISTYGSGPGAASGRLQATPELCDVGSWPVSIRVTDGISFGTHDLLVRVVPRIKASAPLEIASPSVVNDVIVTDVNGDGHQDVVTSGGFSAGLISTYLGDGKGALGARMDTPVQGRDPSSLVDGDWNEDGHRDVAVVFRFEGGVVALLGNGNGTFQEVARYPAGEFLQQVRTADLNADGKADLAVSNGQGTTVTILLGRGDGQFDPAPPAHVGSSPYGLVLADFDRDGRMDLATADFSGRTLSIVLGFGDGTFGDRLEIPFAAEPSGPYGIEAGDLNEDGILDLAVTDYRAKVRIFTGQGDGTFDPGAVLTGFQIPQRIEIAELNGDGHLDLIVTDPSDSFPEFSAAKVLYGGGAGTFGSPLELSSNAAEQATAASDLNEDGLDDVAIVGWGSSLKVWLNTSGGTGDANARVFPVGGNRSLPTSAKSGSVCFRMEPVEGSYSSQDLVLSTIRLHSQGTGAVESIQAVQAKTIVEGDTDKNGVQELGICFSSSDWAQLFSNVRGRQDLTVRIEGMTVDSRPLCSPVELIVIGAGAPLAASVSPNPLNPRATLRFSTSRDGSVKIRMYDLQGRVVRTLLERPIVPAGSHEVEIDGRSQNGQTLASGIYFYEVDAAEGRVRGRLTILK